MHGTNLLQAMRVTPGPAENKEVLNSIDDLQLAFHYFFHKGAGGERSFMDEKSFRQISQSAAGLEDAQVRMANIDMSLMMHNEELIFIIFLCFNDFIQK